MICCLNPSCNNPSNPDETNFCTACGVHLESLRNRYLPIKLLGQGGFAKTYLAQDQEDKINTLCVIKQFTPTFLDPRTHQKATALFEQEAQQLENLGQHPQIPALFAYFKEKDNLYLIQEYVDGQNLLEEFKKHGLLNEKQIIQVLLELLPVLSFVHEQEVIHRDIKPDNIIRRQDGKLFLIDFGVAKPLKQIEENKKFTTIGSWGYAPPEQTKGEKVFPSSDLYSLGVTCFYLLTEVEPDNLWSQQGFNWTGKWRAYLQRPLSKQLDSILDRLLQVDLEKRYQDAQAVLLDVQKLSSTAPSKDNQLKTRIQSSPVPQVQNNPTPLLPPLTVVSGSALIMTIGIFSIAVLSPNIAFLCQSWHNCSPEQQALQDYQKAEILFKSILESLPQANSLQSLQESQENIKKVIFLMQTISDNTSVYSQAKVDLEQLTKIEESIEEKEKILQQPIQKADDVTEKTSPLVEKTPTPEENKKTPETGSPSSPELKQSLSPFEQQALQDYQKAETLLKSTLESLPQANSLQSLQESQENIKKAISLVHKIPPNTEIYSQAKVDSKQLTKIEDYLEQKEKVLKHSGG